MAKPDHQANGKTSRRAPTGSAAQGRDLHFLLFLAILLFGAGLRLYAVETANLWHDEFWTLELSCGRDTAHEHVPTDMLLPSPPGLTSLSDALPWWTVPGSLSQVTHPPLFFLLLRFWRDLLGSSDIAARFLPCVASVAALVLFHRVVSRLNGPGAAIWACLLMALSGQPIFYAQEIRSYSLIVTLGLAALAVLIEIERHGPSPLKLIGFGALVFALVMTHYFTIGLVLGLALYAWIRLPRRAARQTVLTIATAGIAFLLIWGPFMLKQRNAMSLENDGGAAFLLELGSGRVWHTLARVLAVPAQAMAPATFMSPANLPPLISWLAVPAFVLPLAWLRRRPDSLVWYLWVGGVLLPLAILDLSRSSMHLAFPRYTLLAGPGVFAVLAAGYAQLKGIWKHAAPALVVAASAFLLPAALREPSTKQDWQPIASFAAESMQPGDPLIVTAPPDRAPQVYLYVTHYLGPMNRPIAIITRPMSFQLQAELRSHPRVWVITASAQLPSLFGPAQFHPVATTGMADFGRIEWPP